MRYAITARDAHGDEYVATANSERAAVKAARQMVKDYPGYQVHVSWYRESDGQSGYLNPDGNHAITGESWS